MFSSIEIQKQYKSLSEELIKSELTPIYHLMMTYEELFIFMEEVGLKPPNFSVTNREDIAQFFKKKRTIQYINEYLKQAEPLKKRELKSKLASFVKENELYKVEIKAGIQSQIITDYKEITKVPIFKPSLDIDLQAIGDSHFEAIKKDLKLAEGLTKQEWITIVPNYSNDEYILVCLSIYHTYIQISPNTPDAMTMEQSNATESREKRHSSHEEDAHISKKTNNQLTITRNTETTTSTHKTQPLIINSTNNENESAQERYPATSAANENQYRNDYPEFNVATNIQPQQIDYDPLTNNDNYSNKAKEITPPLMTILIDGELVTTVDMNAINPHTYIKIKKDAGIETNTNAITEPIIFLEEETQFLKDYPEHNNSIVQAIMTLQFSDKKKHLLIKSTKSNNQYSTELFSDNFPDEIIHSIAITGITENTYKSTNFKENVAKTLLTLKIPVNLDELNQFNEGSYPKSVMEIADGLPQSYYLKFSLRHPCVMSQIFKLHEAGNTSYKVSNNSTFSIHYLMYLGINFYKERIENINLHQGTIAVVRGVTKEESNTILPMIKRIFEQMLPDTPITVTGIPVFETFLLQHGKKETGKNKMDDTLVHFLITAIVTEAELKLLHTNIGITSKNPRTIIRVGTRALELWPNIEISKGKALHPSVSNTPFVFHIPCTTERLAMNIYNLLTETEKPMVERIHNQKNIDGTYMVYIFKKNIAWCELENPQLVSTIKPENGWVEPITYQLGRNYKDKKKLSPTTNAFLITENDLYDGGAENITEYLKTLSIASNTNPVNRDGFQTVTNSRRKKTKFQA